MDIDVKFMLTVFNLSKKNPENTKVHDQKY